MLERIYNFLRNDNLSFHNKVINIWLLTNKREDFPKLPPEICPCKVTLQDGSTHRAYLDTQMCGTAWIEYGRTSSFKKGGRKHFEFDDVVKWEFIP